MLNKPYLSIQEMLDKTEKQRKELSDVLNGGTWHPDDVSILTNQKPADYFELKESLHNISLAEFLAKSSTTGIMGAAYLIPDKLHDTLIFASKQSDKVPLISAQVAERWEGGDLKIGIASDHYYKPVPFSSGGALAYAEVKTIQATLTPQSFGMPLAIGNDLIEDNAYDLIQYHVEKAGEAVGKYATDLALAVLIAAPDGVGTKNSATSANTDETLWTEVLAAVDGNAQDEWVSNTMITTPESWEDRIGSFDIELGTAGKTVSAPTATSLPAVGFDFKVLNLDTLFSTSPQLHDSADVAEAAFTTCITVVFDRNNALLTGRKRWMEVKNYSNPIEDLAGAVISFRQDSVTLYKDAIYVLTESTS